MILFKHEYFSAKSATACSGMAMARSCASCADGRAHERSFTRGSCTMYSSCTYYDLARSRHRRYYERSYSHYWSLRELKLI